MVCDPRRGGIDHLVGLRGAPSHEGVDVLLLGPDIEGDLDACVLEAICESLRVGEQCLVSAYGQESGGQASEVRVERVGLRVGARTGRD